MCGLAGYINLNISEQEKNRLSQELSHRGPDASGWYDVNSVQFLHRRLSILDLSESSHQPMFSADKRYVIIFNGEVYNYRELIEKYNLTPKTTSDTEVVLDLFIKQGVDFVNELNGMFAIAIYDSVEDKTFLFRDRVGIKPLYYFHNENQFAFSSELKSLKHLGKSIDYNSVVSFLHLGYIPEPNSIYNNIKKFPSGSYGVYKDGNLRIKKFWAIDKQLQKETVTDESNAINELEKLLHKSVEYRLISDVPVGTFLSGGIDSSLVTAIAKEVSNSTINSFSIGFKEKYRDESTYAKAVANHLKTNHHQFILEEGEGVDIIQKLPEIYDEPFADSSGVPTYLISKKTREHVTVALSGDGGDELFMGYGMYTWAKRVSNPFISVFRKPLSLGLELSGNPRMQRAGKVLNYQSKKRIQSHIFSQEQGFFTQKEIKKLLFLDYTPSFEKRIKSPRKLSPEENQSLFDFNNYLKDDLLVKVDRASMANSLEVRVPLLDHNIVEFSFNLNQNLKRKNGEMKYLLKQVLYKYVPKEIFDRPKQGFSIPLPDWLNNQLKNEIDYYLSKDAIERVGILNWDVVNEYKNLFYQGTKPYFYNRIWTMYILQKWIILNEEI